MVSRQLLDYSVFPFVDVLCLGFVSVWWLTHKLVITGKGREFGGVNASHVSIFQPV